MKTFYFGSGSNKAGWGDLWECESKDLEAAINRFKLEILFPEQYVDPEYMKKGGDTGYIIKERDPALDRYIYEFEDNPKIKVTSVSPWFIKDWKTGETAHYHKDTPDPVLECELLLSECINVDYNDILPKQLLLKGTTSTIGLVEKDIKLPVIGSPNALRSKNKVQMREMHDFIKRKQYELEKQKDELNASLQVLRRELDQKMKGLYILETFLGVKETIIQIAEGENAPNNLPLSIYQQLFYMDEEYGAWENQGMDWQNIEDFDKWVVKNIDKFIYRPKGVAAFRVRRNDKTYAYRDGSVVNALTNITMNEPNKYTYFIIRNGGNIYRIFSNISVHKRLFPTTTEYQKILEEHKGHRIFGAGIDEDAGEYKVKEHHENYMYGFTAIQGLIERTPIFPGMQGKTNLLIGNTTNIELIRDDEKEFWLKDERLNWYDFAKKNRETIKIGSRIVLHLDRYETDKSRFTGGNPGYFTTPKTGIFVVMDSQKENKDFSNYYGYDFKILYNPGDTVYTDYYGPGHDRKRRVGLLLYNDEVLNFDEITVADCDYYMQNRNYRNNYLNILPLLAKIKEWKQAEFEKETPLVELVLNQMNLDSSYEIEVRQAILWWKIKNKWKRNVMDNDNVIRMVTKRLKEILK